MSPRPGTRRSENPVCTTEAELPPPPSVGELVDPAEPHPEEPGAPDDAPDPQPVRDAG